MPPTIWPIPRCHTSGADSESERTGCPCLLKFRGFLSLQAILNQPHRVLRLRQWSRVLTHPCRHLHHRRLILYLRSNHYRNRLRSPGAAEAVPPQLDLPISYNIAPKQDVLVIRYKRVLIVSQSFWFGRKWTPVSEIGPQLCEKVFKQWFRKACPRVADIEQSAFVVDS